MHTTSLRKVGGSVMLAVPPALLDVLQLSAGARVALTVQDGRLVIERPKRPHYTLDQLLAQCDAATPLRRTKADREWLEGAPVGRELL